MAQPSTRKIDKETFRDIFKAHWSGFKARYPFYNRAQYEDAVQKMLGCGKEEGGYSEYICLRCGRSLRRIAFTCKSSFCLSCAKVYVDDFVSQVSRVLHPGVTYRHVVLTMPKQLKIYFYRGRFAKTLISALMRCGYKCLEDVVSQVKKHAVKIGAIVVIQTHGRSGRFNPHLHILMTSGGINEQKGKWEDFNYFPYEIIHKKWQYHLFKMMKEMIRTERMAGLVDKLWKEYPSGIVANVQRGEVPEKCKGLAKYLAKYLASPPISVRRIVRYEGLEVTYWYNDHETKRKKVETVDVYTFIGRMVQHIFPKGFQRVRYYGLQATRTFTKWCEVIKEGLKRIGRTVKGVYQILSNKRYRERYKEVSGRDPMICDHCGAEMELSKIWHPKYGVIYDVFKDSKAWGSKGNGRRGGRTVRSPSGVLQLSLFPLPV
ncbi:MAG: transposase [Euryarchaeota archaeon]|nr:transposase [Euryarchaeota archaeon]